MRRDAGSGGRGGSSIRMVMARVQQVTRQNVVTRESIAGSRMSSTLGVEDV